ncbi:hypothetical protein IFM89_021073 [Coptis chinensis]|uniref:DNA gyrase B subunit C-terminal domain-containing protein n=1 Tax=Coptis chinensis TaxID=261450 RepID=A0A835LI41_9MAGN|nr:hypothetical protein IFM89_021073 [Coptis chinensis]
MVPTCVVEHSTFYQSFRLMPCLPQYGYMVFFVQKPIHDTIAFRNEVEGITIDLALQCEMLMPNYIALKSYKSSSNLMEVERGKRAHYCYDKAQLKTLQSTFPSNASYNIQRFKDLGEMMPLQLWETTMDPEKRMLKQLVVEDAAEENMVFSSLMGERVDVQKELITKAASTFSLEQLDI